MTEVPIGIVAILALVGAHIIWVLLPLAPAVLIYLLFPNTPVAVSGPLSGLTVRAGGAFGAYLVVLLLTYGQLRTIDQSIAMLDSQFWNVRGTVQLIDSKARPIDSPDLLQKLVVVTKPETHLIDKYEIRLRIVQETDGSLPITVINSASTGSCGRPAKRMNSNEPSTSRPRSRSSKRAARAFRWRTCRRAWVRRRWTVALIPTLPLRDFAGSAGL